jgi:hypothetical protein
LIKNYAENNTKLQKLRKTLFPLIKYPQMMLESEITKWQILEIVYLKQKKPESFFPVLEIIWHTKTSILSSASSPQIPSAQFSDLYGNSSPEFHRTCKFISPSVKILDTIKCWIFSKTAFMGGMDLTDHENDLKNYKIVHRWCWRAKTVYLAFMIIIICSLNIGLPSKIWAPVKKVIWILKFRI